MLNQKMGIHSQAAALSKFTAQAHQTALAWSADVRDPVAKLVLLSLAAQVDEYAFCSPSVAEIARTCGISTSSTRSRIAELVEHGFINRTRRTGEHGGNLSNLYRLTIAEGLVPPVDYEARREARRQHDEISAAAAARDAGEGLYLDLGW